MYTSQVTDLEALLRRHLPRDSNDAATAHVLETWKRELADATSVRVEWVDRYGRRLQASWFGPHGDLRASTARPLEQADRVRRFVLDWQHLMERHGQHVHVTWQPGTHA